MASAHIQTTSTSTSTTTRKRSKRPHPHNHHLRHHNLHHHLLLLLTSTTTASQHDLDLFPSQSQTLASKLTSTCLSLSKLDSILHTLNPSKTLSSPPPPPPPPPPLPSSSSQCWFQRFLSSSSSNTQWLQTFRMSKPSFNLLLQTLTPTLQNSSSNTLPPDYALAAFLYRLAHAASYSSVGRRFGVDSDTAYRTFYEVCQAIIDRLGHLFNFGTDMKRVLEGFGGIALPNCCGVLGYSRFLVNGGKDRGLIVQGLVDSEGRFLDVSAGWPSLMSPSTILPKTKLLSRVEELRELLSGDLVELSCGNWIPQYVLGDSCCPLLQWVLTPFKKARNEGEGMFNSIHYQRMGLVSTAFGRVKTWWKLLSVEWEEQCVESFPFVIVAGCLLHNFLIKCGEVGLEEIKVYLREEFSVFEGEGDETAEEIRNALASRLVQKGGGQISTQSTEEDTRLYKLA